MILRKFRVILHQPLTLHLKSNIEENLPCIVDE